MVLQLSTRTGPSIILHSPIPAEDPYPLITPVEEHVILRLDPALAQRVQNQINQEGYPKDLQINFNSSRTAIIAFQELEREAILVDLPCIIESQKTIDKKQFYKINDICQMLVVSGGGGNSGTEDKINSHLNSHLFPDQQQQQQSYRWPHGLTAPLWNVRSRIFKKTKNKGLSGDDVEILVQSLLERDAQSINTEYSIQPDTTIDDISDLVAKIEENLMDEEEFKEGQKLDEEEFESFVEDVAIQYQTDQQQEFYQEEQEEETIDDTLLMMENDTFTSELQNVESEKIQTNLLLDEIVQLETKLDKKIRQLQQAPPNPLIRQRIMTVIEQLQDEIQQKRQKLGE